MSEQFCRMLAGSLVLLDRRDSPAVDVSSTEVKTGTQWVLGRVEWDLYTQNINLEVGI